MTRAKFKVNEVSKRMGSVKDGNTFVTAPLYTISLNPVVSGSAENSAFFAATPNGSIMIGGLSEAVANTFQLDGEYYIDFTLARQ